MPDSRAARHGPRDFRRHFAVAAADIENVFVAAQIELGDEFARPGLLHDGIRGVIRRIPFCGIAVGALPDGLQSEKFFAEKLTRVKLKQQRENRRPASANRPAAIFGSSFSA